MMSHSEIQRRTAEQIVDLPAPVFTERILAKDLGAERVHRTGQDPKPAGEVPRSSKVSLRSGFLNGVRLSKCPRSRAREVPR